MTSFNAGFNHIDRSRSKSVVNQPLGKLGAEHHDAVSTDARERLGRSLSVGQGHEQLGRGSVIESGSRSLAGLRAEFSGRFAGTDNGEALVRPDFLRNTLPQGAVGFGNEQLSGKTIENVMTTYAQRLGIDTETFNVADAICKGSALINSQDTPEATTVEDVRNVAWYLQAKALSDHRGAEKLPLIQRGTMVIDDPDGRLLKIFSQCPQSYARPSSHFNEGGRKMQNTEKGIEDFHNLMPGGRGHMLFGGLQFAGKPQRQVFVKFESDGFPWKFWNNRDIGGTNAQGGAAVTRWQCFKRAWNHCLHFIGIGKPTITWGNFREKIQKAPGGKELIGAWKALTKVDVTQRPTRTDFRGRPKYLQQIKDGNGLQFLQNRLQDLTKTYGNLDEADPTKAAKLKALGDLELHINDFKKNNPTVDGIQRFGGEVHLDPMIKQ